jgi:hypothetical protein
MDMGIILMATTQMHFQTQLWNGLDTDGDLVGNNEDAFPFDPSQNTDSDGDGFGDNPMGNGADRFP